MALDIEAVLRHATALQRVTSLRELMRETHVAVTSGTRYRQTWLALIRPELPEAITVVQVAGDVEELVLERCPTVPIAGDAMVAEILANRTPVVVVEAKDDPRTNKAIVAALGNRTIINVPLLLGTDLLGMVGLGTFGDEGPVAPTADELEYLVVVATQLAGAYARLRLLERQRREAEQRVELERQLERLQRVELMGVQSAGVAHDLNNYLMVVRSSLELLQSGDLRTAADDLADARLATEKSIQVVQQLLALGRSARTHEGVFELSARLRDSLQVLRPVIPRNIELVTQLEQPARVVADPVQVEQAIANLVLNARDAISSVGRIEVAVDTVTLGPDDVRAYPAARPGRFARMSVRDTGQGISPENLHRIFEPLFTTKAKGTGLGLAVVARVAQQHHGLVACESTVGQGSTFRFMLPLAAV